MVNDNWHLPGAAAPEERRQPMQTYKFRAITAHGDMILGLVSSFIFMFPVFVIWETVHYPDIQRFLKTASQNFIDLLRGLVILFLPLVWYRGEKKLLGTVTKNFTVQLDNLAITVWADGQKVLHGDISDCEITDRKAEVRVDVYTRTDKISFRARPARVKAILTNVYSPNPFGACSPEDMEELLSLGKAIQRNMGIDLNLQGGNK